MEGVMHMVAAYNLYLGGYIPRVSPQSSVHNRSELKTKYKNIVSMNNSTPQSVVRISDKTQAYVLDVKELAMELEETTESILSNKGSPKDLGENIQHMTETFNQLLKDSDEFGLANGKPSRPGGELRNMIRRHTLDLLGSGFAIDNDGFLTAPDYGESDTPIVPTKFISELASKSEEMSMNPMEYIEQKVYSYAHLHHNDVGSAYEPSIYSGMLFNSYC